MSSHHAGQFLQPWTTFSGHPPKDYSQNKAYAVGVKIITEWEADFSNATVTLNQDNNPGDAQGGPSVVLERSYDKKIWDWTVSYEGMDPSFNNVFYFSVSDGKKEGGESFTGRYFNISAAASSSSTASASSRSSSSPSSSRSSKSSSKTYSSPFSTSAAAANASDTDQITISFAATLGGTPTPTSSSGSVTSTPTATVTPSSGSSRGAGGSVRGVVKGLVVGALVLGCVMSM